MEYADKHLKSSGIFLLSVFDQSHKEADDGQTTELFVFSLFLLSAFFFIIIITHIKKS